MSFAWEKVFMHRLDANIITAVIYMTAMKARKIKFMFYSCNRVSHIKEIFTMKGVLMNCIWGALRVVAFEIHGKARNYNSFEFNVFGWTILFVQCNLTSNNESFSLCFNAFVCWQKTFFRLSRTRYIVRFEKQELQSSRQSNMLKRSMTRNKTRSSMTTFSSGISKYIM